MSERDWAIETAYVIYHTVKDNFAGESKEKICNRIAFDLCKAKADGIREAADRFEGPRNILTKWIDDCRSGADRIERREFFTTLI